MIPSTVLITTDNPLASRWQRDSTCPEETPDGYRDEFFEYVMNFLVPANLFAQDLFITFDKEADFVLRAIEPSIYQVGNPQSNLSSAAFRLKDGFGNALSDDMLCSGSGGTGFSSDVHGPIFPELVLPAGSRFFADIDNTQNAFQVQVAITLRGCKRYKL